MDATFVVDNKVEFVLEIDPVRKLSDDEIIDIFKIFKNLVESINDINPSQVLRNVKFETELKFRKNEYFHMFKEKLTNQDLEQLDKAEGKTSTATISTPTSFVNTSQKQDKILDDTFVMPFGKHKTKTIKQIIAEEASYVKWLIEAEVLSNGTFADYVQVDVYEACEQQK